MTGVFSIAEAWSESVMTLSYLLLHTAGQLAERRLPNLTQQFFSDNAVLSCPYLCTAGKAVASWSAGC